MCVLWSIWHGGLFLWGQSKGHRAQRGEVSLNWGRLFIILTFIVPLLFRIMITLLILPSPARFSSLCVLSDERPLQTCILEFCNCAVTSSPPTSNQIDFSSAAPSPHCTHLPFYSPSFHVPPPSKKKAHTSPSSNTIHSQIEPSFCPDSTHLQASSQSVIGIVKVPARAPGGLMGTDGMIAACITCEQRSVF